MWRESLLPQNIHVVTRENSGALRLTDKWELIESLRQALCARERVTAALAAEIKTELVARERLMSTGIGEQVAIPHAVVPGTDRFMTECVIVRDGIDFESIDSSKTFIVVMLIAPKSALQEHLKVMASIAKVFYRAQTRAAIIAAKTPEEVLKIINAA
ncbi:MAG: PTS sugar transporter subunit IIA [Spirochaetes bacterium]|nr:PTS sugar transporter subunit IIA [Spirochaetota bacterium]